jgi:hypothetical protein
VSYPLCLHYGSKIVELLKQAQYIIIFQSVRFLFRFSRTIGFSFIKHQAAHSMVMLSSTSLQNMFHSGVLFLTLVPMLEITQFIGLSNGAQKVYAFETVNSPFEVLS